MWWFTYFKRISSLLASFVFSVLTAPSLYACAVCLPVGDRSLMMYYVTTILLSIVPLVFVGLIFYFVFKYFKHEKQSSQLPSSELPE